MTPDFSTLRALLEKRDTAAKAMDALFERDSFTAEEYGAVYESHRAARDEISDIANSILPELLAEVARLQQERDALRESVAAAETRIEALCRNHEAVSLRLARVQQATQVVDAVGTDGCKATVQTLRRLDRTT